MTATSKTRRTLIFMDVALDANAHPQLRDSERSGGAFDTHRLFDARVEQQDSAVATEDT